MVHNQDIINTTQDDLVEGISIIQPMKDCCCDEGQRPDAPDAHNVRKESINFMDINGSASTMINSNNLKQYDKGSVTHKDEHESTKASSEKSSKASR